MSYRRFHITFEEARIVLLALSLLQEKLADQDDPYWIDTKHRATMLEKNLTNYNWIRE